MGHRKQRLAGNWTKSSPAVTQHAIDSQTASNQGFDSFEYENYILKTRFVNSQGHDLRFVPRKDIMATCNAVTFCHNLNLDALLAALDSKITTLILVNSLSKSKSEKLAAKKTQIIVSVKNVDRVMSVFAIILGGDAVSAVQQAWKLDVVDADSVAGILRLRQDAAPEQVYDAICKKEGLSMIAGSLAKDIDFLSRKFEADPEATRWTWEAKRDKLRGILHCSGTCEANIQIDRAEEDKLSIIPVFASASSAEAVREKLGSVPHLGVVGPTTTGWYTVRATAECISQVRRMVLSSTSTFLDMWDLVITHKFVGKFPKKHHMSSIAASMKASMKWKSVPIQQRPAGKGYHHVTLGSDVPPPSLHVVMGEETVILHPEPSEKGDALTSTFEVTVREETPAMSAGSRAASTLPSGVEQLCTNQLRTAEARLEQRMQELQTEAKATIVAAADSTALAVTKRLEETQHQRDKTVDELKKVVQDQAGQLKAYQEATAGGLDAVNQRISGMAKQCEEQFAKVDHILADHTAQMVTMKNHANPQKYKKPFKSRISHATMCISGFHLHFCKSKLFRTKFHMRQCAPQRFNAIVARILV